MGGDLKMIEMKRFFPVRVPKAGGVQRTTPFDALPSLVQAILYLTAPGECFYSRKNPNVHRDDVLMADYILLRFVQGLRHDDAVARTAEKHCLSFDRTEAIVKAYRKSLEQREGSLAQGPSNSEISGSPAGF